MVQMIQEIENAVAKTQWITMAVFGYFHTKSPRLEISTNNEPNNRLITH